MPAITGDLNLGNYDIINIGNATMESIVVTDGAMFAGIDVITDVNDAAIHGSGNIGLFSTSHDANTIQISALYSNLLINGGLYVNDASNGITILSTNGNTYAININASSGGIALTSNSPVNISNDLIINSTTNATNSTTGSLAVAGGMGLAKDLYIGGLVDISNNLVIHSTTNATNSTSGSIKVSGGMGLAKDLFIGGLADVSNNLVIHSTTNATNSITGSIVSSGGMGIAKDAYVGGSIYQNGYMLVPVGVILQYSASTAPSGFLLCDGSQISRTTYSILFMVIGTTYGSGDGSTTFTLPDLRNKFPIGSGSTYSIGAAGGSATNSLIVANLPSHSHTGTTNSSTTGISINDPGHSHTQYEARDDGNISNQAGQYPPGDANTGFEESPPQTGTSTTGITLNDNGHTHSFTTSSVGSGTSFSILNPYIALTFIIKY